MNLGRGIWVFLLFVFISITAHSTPKMLFDPNALPFPKVPFPNNTFTLPDATSPTGLKIHYPFLLTKNSQFEKRMRDRINELNGFGTFSPILVSFSEPLDLATLQASSIKVINLTKTSSSYGKTVPLDFGSGLFEYLIEKPTSYFPNDPQSTLNNFLFKESNRNSFYEDETNTVILRPLTPLEEESHYGVILTHALKGLDGTPITTDVQSSQTLLEELKTAGINTQDIVYCWEFTTQSITRNLKLIREGLYGKGMLSQLSSQYPPQFREISDLKTFPFDIDGNSYTLTPTVLQKVFVNLTSLAAKLHLIDGFPFDELIDWSSVNYFVFGSYLSPQFNKNNSESLQSSVPEPVYFMMAIPKETPGHKAPFPITIFGHGNKRNRIDAIGLANKMAEGGMATITIDAAGHGPDNFLAAIPVYLKRFFTFPMAATSEEKEAVKEELKELGQMVGVTINDKDLQTESLIGRLIDRIFRQGILRVLTREGRATDVNEDGITDSGEDFFSANFFSTRDIVRQTIVDFFQLTRVVKELGRDLNNNGTLEIIEGDFNRDGILDVGGPNTKIHYIGMSMGGMIGGLLMGTEPEVKTGILNVGGGGLTDILFRTSSKFNAKRIFYQLWGPAFIGIHENNKTYLTINSGRTEDAFAVLQPLDPKGTVFLRNKTKNTVFKTPINDQKGFLSRLASDRGDRIELDIFNSFGLLDYHIDYTITYQEGLGLTRNTPDFLRFAFLGQWAVDPADPMNYTKDWKDKSVLLQLSLGDWTVPILSGINLARVAGLISPPRVQWLLSKNIHQGEIVKVDTELNPPESLHGSAIRFHPSGKHEYLIIPNLKDKEMMSYTPFTQAQVLRYFLSSGELID